MKNSAHKIEDLYKQAKRISDNDKENEAKGLPKKHDLFDTKIMELDGHLGLFLALAKNDTPRVVIPPVSDKETWYPLGEFMPADGDFQ